MSNQMYLDGFLIVLVLTAALKDLAVRKIPNRLVLCGLSSAGVLHLVSGNPLNILSIGLAGAAVGLVIFLPLYCLRGMAAGDVKLMAMTGAFTGPMLAFEIALAAYCAGGVMALVIVIANGRWRDLALNLRALLRPLYMRIAGIPYAKEAMPRGSVGGMPYGLAIAAATCLMLWMRRG
jgi:prepilin peptidase CpaA